MITQSEHRYPLLYVDQPGHIATGLIGSHARRCADSLSDYDLICLWDDNKWMFATSDNIRIVETEWRDTDVQTFFYKHNWVAALVSFFSKGGDISGDWGELGVEAYLAFLQQAQFLAGDRDALRRIQQSLKYPESYRTRVLLQQASRMLNSLRQFFHSRKRSAALLLKCRYDFLDSVLRMQYAREGLFYSTIKWYSQDLKRFGTTDPLQASLHHILNGSSGQVIESCVVAAAAVIERLDVEIAAEVVPQISHCVRDGEKRGFNVEALRLLLSQLAP